MNAQQLKNSILQEAIEGRLVPQDPNDEPASVLLNRIREEKKQLVKAGKLKKKDLEEKPISEDEKPFEIPDSWEWVRLGEVSTYANTKKKINAAKADPNLWGLDLEDIEKGGRLLFLKSVGERKAIGDKTCFLEGDILYSKLRPYLLKILIAPKDGICTPEIIPFTCYGCLCKEYIVYILKSAYVDDYINSVTFGVKMPRVSTETMVSLVIPIPPLAEQKRIVAKIEELLPKVEEYGKAQDALDKLNAELPERLKKSILQEAIEGRLVPQDPNDEPASILLDKIRAEKAKLVKEGKLKKKDLEETPIQEDEIPFEIPASWEWVRISDYANKVTDFVASGSFATLRENVKYYKEDNYALMVKTKDFQSNFSSDLTFTDKKGYDFLSNSNLFGGELIISNVGSIGKIFIVPKLSRKMTLAPNAIMVRLWDDSHRDWLYYLFQSEFGVSLLYNISSATAIRKFNKTDFKGLLIPIPPLAEQKRIVAKIEQLLGEIDKLK